MKKILIICMCIVTIFVMVACKNNEPTQSVDSTANGESETMHNNNFTNETIPPDDTIRPLGELPLDPYLLTVAEKEYIHGELYDQVLNAVLDLDMDVLSKHTKYQCLDGFEQISSDESFKAIYKNTIGTAIYLPESGHIVCKDINYIFASWITNCYVNNTAIPGDISQLSKEQIDEIYEKYGKDAPYLVKEIQRDFNAVHLEEGSVYYDTDLMLKGLVNCNVLSSRTPSNEQRNVYAEYLFDEFTLKELDKTTIKGSKSEYEIIFHFNNETLYEKFVNSEIDSTNLELQNIKSIFQNQDNLNLIKDWFSKNCKVIATTECVYIYYITNDQNVITSYELFKDLTEDEIAKLQSMKFCHYEIIDTENVLVKTLSNIIAMAEKAGVKLQK